MTETPPVPTPPAPAPRTRHAWDGIGIAISSLCLVHCLAPVALAGSAALAGLAHDAHDPTHQLFFAAAAVTGLLALIPGYRRHRAPLAMAFAGAGFAFLFAGAFLAHDVFGHGWEMPLTVAGGSLLIAAHFTNLRACRRVHDHHPGDACHADAEPSAS